jgi:hypothetical protein
MMMHQCLIVCVMWIVMIQGRHSLVAPQLQPIVAPKEVSVGESVHLLCMFTRGSLPVRFNWLHHNHSVKASERLQFENSSPYSSVLILNSVQAEDQGPYTCRAENTVGSDQTLIQLRVLTPPTWNNQLGDISRQTSGPIEITCSATGFPKPQIAWYRLIGMNLHKQLIQSIPSNDYGMID